MHNYLNRVGYLTLFGLTVSRSQDTGTLEKHSFATSTFTQFCILFKRTFITICRDMVKYLLHELFWLRLNWFPVMNWRLLFFSISYWWSVCLSRCLPTSGWCPICVLESWLACFILKLEMMPARSSTTLVSSFSPCCSLCLPPWCPLS